MRPDAGSAFLAAQARPLPLTYVLPLRAATPAEPELVGYLDGLRAHAAQIVVVDGSAPAVAAGTAAALPAGVVHIPVDPARVTSNGKVGGVLTGLAVAAYDAVVVADDDVRWTRSGLDRALRLLGEHQLVAPANYYAPLPWHAVYDTGRQLVQRALGKDFPGTLVVRRGVLLAAGGYRGDVLFENLEMIRTVEAVGGDVFWSLDLLVERRPPTVRHFAGQRVRQAYDEFARPAHLAAALTVLPAVALRAARRGESRLRAPAALVCLVWLGAEWGRRRAGGRSVFPVAATVLAPLWVVERGVCAWVALWWWLRGGVPYRGSRLRTAAHSRRWLRQACAGRGVPVRTAGAAPR